MSFKTQKQYLTANRALMAMAFGFAVVFACAGAARANDSDPFQMEPSHWMSFDHYKDAVKRGLIAPSHPQADATGDGSAASRNPHGTTAHASATPVVAAPQRPINLPVMPGINHGFNLQVSTTADDNAAPSSPPAFTMKAGSDDSDLPAQGWQAPATVAQGHKNTDGDEDDGSGDTPVDVRLSYLPNEKIVPAPEPKHISAQSLTNAIVMRRQKMKQQASKATPAAAATCAAIDAYKKQQLDAIQGDQRTLKALQDAIATLGLQKQLDFMTNGGSALVSTDPKAHPDGASSATVVR